MASWAEASEKLKAKSEKLSDAKKINLLFFIVLLLYNFLKRVELSHLISDFTRIG